MIFSGQERAKSLKDSLKVLVRTIDYQLTLVVIQIGEDEATEKFIERKHAFARDLGIKLEHIVLPDDVCDAEVVELIEGFNEDDTVSGIIVQLPLPDILNTDVILNSIDPKKDPDRLCLESCDDTSIIPPVAGVVKEILETSNVDLNNKKVLVVGRGRLVGKPVIAWLKGQNIEPEVIDMHSEDKEEKLREADVIITGAGDPYFIKPEHIKEGVVIIDFGAPSGDADPACADKCSLFTPTPGGTGPLVVAKLFENLIKLNQES